MSPRLRRKRGSSRGQWPDAREGEAAGSRLPASPSQAPRTTERRCLSGQPLWPPASLLNHLRSLQGARLRVRGGRGELASPGPWIVTTGGGTMGRVQPLCREPERLSGFLCVLVQSASPSVKREPYSSPCLLGGEA